MWHEEVKRSYEWLVDTSRDNRVQGEMEMNQQIIDGIKKGQRNLVLDLMHMGHSLEVEINDQYSKYHIRLVDGSRGAEINELEKIESMAKKYLWLAKVEAHDRYGKIAYPCLTILIYPDLQEIGREHV